MTRELHPEIVCDIGGLLSDLARLGLVPYDNRYSPESFGDYFVDFRLNDGFLRIVRDRGQYFVSGFASDVLDPVGLWRAFDDRDEFAERLIEWLRASGRRGPV